MIKPNELRIGNYVNNGKRIVKIELIDFCDIYENWHIFHNYIGYCSSDLNDCKPILLTEEIVLKCGFVLDILNNGDLPVLMNDNNFYINSKTFQPQDGGFNICRHEIKYLHQLQNLYFALTQKELEINFDN